MVILRYALTNSEAPSISKLRAAQSSWTTSRLQHLLHPHRPPTLCIFESSNTFHLSSTYLRFLKTSIASLSQPHDSTSVHQQCLLVQCVGTKRILANEHQLQRENIHYAGYHLPEGDQDLASHNLSSTWCKNRWHM